MVALMAGRAIQRPRAVQSLSLPSVGDEATQRALDALDVAIQRLQAGRSRQVVTADLVVGTNEVQHGLGRPAAGYTLVPTVADATFAHAIDDTNPHPEREIWVVVVGVAQPGARLEIW